MGFVYQIVNDVNGKIYVGKTELYPPEKRWQEHVKDYKRERCEKRPLYDAMNKYGVEHFHFSVIEETDNAYEREIYWIEKLRTYIGYKDCNGYNATLGGDGKKYLNLNENEVVDYHINQANLIVGRTAKYFGVDAQTIIKILLKLKVVWLNADYTNIFKFYEKRGLIYQVDCNKKIVGVYVTSTEVCKKYPEINHYMLNKIVKGINVTKELYYYMGYYWYCEDNIPDDIQEIVSL